MRASHLFEAGLVVLLIIAAVGAFSAWKVLNSRSQRPAVETIDQANNEAVVRKAEEAVQTYARFALRISGSIFIDETSVEVSPLAPRGGSPMWSVAGRASADSIDAPTFSWIVHIIASHGEPEVDQVKINGQTVFAAAEQDAAAAANAP